jgi:hypothetical protein
MPALRPPAPRDRLRRDRLRRDCLCRRPTQTSTTADTDRAACSILRRFLSRFYREGIPQDDLLGLIDSAHACLHDVGKKFDQAEPAPYPLQVLQRGFAICLATSPIALPDGSRQPDMADMLATHLECSLCRGTLSVWGPPAVAPA